MGELTAIGFRPGRSPLHRLDPRTKQALLMTLCVISVWGQRYFLATLTALTILLGHAAGLRIGRLMREIRYFLLFLLFVFAVHVIDLGDRFIPSVNWPAAAGALIVCWRILLVVCLGLLVMATTRIAHIRAALVWFLKLIPLIDERMAATMVGLVVRFLPLILFQAAEIADAQRARGIERRKNPFIRLMKFSIPLFRRVFLSADELVAAMQARCYSDQRTLPDLSFGWRDGVAAGTVALISLTVWLP